MKMFKKAWGYMVAPTRYQGIYQVQKGGYLARARIKDPAGKQVEIMKVLDCGTPREAHDWLELEKTKVRTGSVQPASKLFSVFAADVLDRKLARRDIQSAANEEKWRVVLGHLIGGSRKRDTQRFEALATSW